MSPLEVVQLIAQLSVPVLAVFAAYVKIRERLVRMDTKIESILEHQRLERERITHELERVADRLNRRKGDGPTRN